MAQTRPRRSSSSPLTTFAAWAGIGSFIIAILTYFSGAYQSYLEAQIVGKLDGTFAGSYWCKLPYGQSEQVPADHVDSFGIFILDVRTTVKDENIQAKGTYTALRGPKPWVREFDVTIPIRRRFAIDLQDSAERLNVKVPVFGMINIYLVDSPNDCVVLNADKLIAKSQK